MNALAYPFDVIITKSREQVQCIILSSTEELITYQYVDDASQTFTMSTSEIEKIYSRDDGPVISFTSKPEPPSNVTKKMKVLNEENPEPITEKDIQPDEVLKELESAQNIEDTKLVEAPVSEQTIAHVEKPTVSAEDELKFQQFMSSINGPNNSPKSAAKVEEVSKEDELTQNTISIFIIGLEENQADIQQVIESETLSKLNTIKGYKARIEDAPKGISEDSIITIAIGQLSKFAFIIYSRPFQEQYYLQSNLINASNGEHLVSTSTASTLISLEDLLTTANKLTEQVVEYFQKQEVAEKEELQVRNGESDKKAAQQKEKENIIHDDTYTLEIVNMHNYQCRVIVAGRIIGIANPWSKQRFKVPLDLYGKVQIIQNMGYKSHPEEATYYIPQQSSQTVLTLTMD